VSGLLFYYEIGSSRRRGATKQAVASVKAIWGAGFVGSVRVNARFGIRTECSDFCTCPPILSRRRGRVLGILNGSPARSSTIFEGRDGVGCQISVGPSVNS
jgi:hypothetical protein